MKGERIFGFSFLKLLQSDGTVLQDGVHDMIVYKVRLMLKRDGPSAGP